jgi:hypothetical protein
MDVGVDCSNFTPWAWEHLKQRLDSEVNKDQIVDTRGEPDTHYFFSEKNRSDCEELDRAWMDWDGSGLL